MPDSIDSFVGLKDVSSELNDDSSLLTFHRLQTSTEMAATCIQSSEEEDEMRIQAKLGFARRLASPDKCKREKAISLLCLWLISQKEVKEDELRKIWKGLFHCVWHADKSTVQVDLIDRLASLLEKLDVNLSLLFFKVFLTTMRREWAGIDRLRSDKFYLLLRKYIAHVFVVLDVNGWDSELTRRFMDALVERTFLTKDLFAADAINIHITDVFLRELRKFGALQVETFGLLLEPFWMVLAKGFDKAFAKRCREKIFRALSDLGLRTVKARQEEKRLDEYVEHFGTIALTLPISATASKLAASPSIPQSNRRLLYEIHEEFRRLESLPNESGISVLPPGEERRKTVVWEKELVTGANAGKNCPLSLSSDNVNREPKDALVSPKQTNSGNAFKPGKNICLGFASALGFSEAETNSLVNLELNENVPPDQKLENPLVKKSLKACLHQIAENWDGLEKMSPADQNKKYNGRFIRATMPEQCLERPSPVVEIAQTSKERQGSESVDKSELGGVCVLESSVENREEAVEKVDSNQRPAAGRFVLSDEECAKLRDITSENILIMDDSVISNLAKRFDSIAAEESGGCQSCLSPEVFSTLALTPANTGSKKRKSCKRSPLAFPDGDSFTSTEGSTPFSRGVLLQNSAASVDSSSAKKAKKVRFSMKHNLVWKPSTPLPPEILRVPPSATPRGSALKKGVSPGPILILREFNGRCKKTASKKSPSGLRTPKGSKSSARGSKLVKKGRLSPR